MKIHRHVGVVKAADALTLKEALAAAAVQHKVLAMIGERACVLERADAKALAEALDRISFHPRVIEGDA
ncbi:MAG: hypothetical protein KDB07_00835 [Planctomycetes bacterium]|nr:hypothetical protein [Planctomycetota bacterium]